MSYAETGKCALCGKEYTHYGNNPQPLLPDIDQRVCDECNALVVIARLQQFAEQNDKEQG